MKKIVVGGVLAACLVTHQVFEANAQDCSPRTPAPTMVFPSAGATDVPKDSSIVILNEGPSQLTLEADGKFVPIGDRISLGDGVAEPWRFQPLVFLSGVIRDRLCHDITRVTVRCEPY